MSSDLLNPVFRGKREQLVDIIGTVLLVVSGFVGGAGSSTSPVVAGYIGVIGVILTLFSWNDIGIGCKIEGHSVVGNTITGKRRIDVSRATRILAYRIRGRWQIRIAGPDGAIAVSAKTPLIIELVRSIILNHPSQVAVTKKASRYLNLPLDLPIRHIRGGRFGGILLGVFSIFVASGFLGAALFYRA